MSLRYVDLLSCGCAPTVCLATGFVAFFSVLRSSAGSGCAGSCGFSSPIWFTTFAMGSPLRGRGWFDPRYGMKVWYVSLSLLGCFFVLPLSFGIWSPYGSGVLVGSHLYATSGCHWCLALYAYGWASSLCLRPLFAPCRYRRVSWWSSLRPRVLGCSWLSPVFFPIRWYGYMTTCIALDLVRRLSFLLGPISFWMGFDPLSEASLRACRCRHVYW